jgi:uncharacterized protein
LIFVLQQNGILEQIYLESDINKEQLFQYMVPANCRFASRPAPGSSFCFVACTVAQGFDFADFELGSAKKLSDLYLQHTCIIKELCR